MTLAWGFLIIAYLFVAARSECVFYVLNWRRDTIFLFFFPALLFLPFPFFSSFHLRSLGEYAVGWIGNYLLYGHHDFLTLICRLL